MNYLSQWLDHWLQKLKPFMPSFLKDGDQLLHLIHQLGPLPPGVDLAGEGGGEVGIHLSKSGARKV